MIIGLREAIFDASTQLGSAACDAGNHQWISEGGRSCPKELTSHCSQTVYHCKVCGQYDHGEKGGPGDTDCSWSCKFKECVRND